MEKLIVFLTVSTLVLACQRNTYEKDSFASTEMSEEINRSADVSYAPMSPPDKVEFKEVVKKKIIKDGRLGIRVTDLEKTKLYIDTLLRFYEGYYANETYNNTDWESTYSLKVRIPVLNFNKLIKGIEKGEGEVLYKEIDARDVTDQFIDIETRLENKKNYLHRYTELLKQAKTIEEILQIEEKIRGLEEEIESATGKLKYLNDLVDYSTLELTLTKRNDFKYNPVDRDKFSERLKQSISKGWFGFVDLLLFIIKIWPFWIIILLGFYLWKKYNKAKLNVK